MKKVFKSSFQENCLCVDSSWVEKMKTKTLKVVQKIFKSNFHGYQCDDLSNEKCYKIEFYIKLTLHTMTSVKLLNNQSCNYTKIMKN